jgi:hypothetical protein
LLVIQGNLNFSKAKQYFQLAKKFLNNQINGDNFSNSYLTLYGGTDFEVAAMCDQESLNLAYFLKPNPCMVRDLFEEVFNSCKTFRRNLDFDETFSDRRDLDNCVGRLLLKLL